MVHDRLLARTTGPTNPLATVVVDSDGGVMTILNDVKECSTVRLNYEKTGPLGIKALGGVHGYVAQSGLDPALVELVYLRVSQINGCAYCLDLHTRALLGKGVAPEKLAVLQVWREAAAAFGERERAALAWAETVTRVAETAIPEEAFRTVSAVFGEKEVVDLTIAVGLMNTFNRIAIGFRRPPRIAAAGQ